MINLFKKKPKYKLTFHDKEYYSDILEDLNILEEIQEFKINQIPQTYQSEAQGEA